MSEDAVISSYIIPYALIRKASSPGTRDEMWLAIMSDMPNRSTRR
jgi:hypothetical protein